MQSIIASVMEDVLPKGQLKTSSNEAMANSLTDGSTETFWESRDEPRGQPRKLTVSFDKERSFFACAVHIDNQKDGGVSIQVCFSSLGIMIVLSVFYIICMYFTSPCFIPMSWLVSNLLSIVAM